MICPTFSARPQQPHQKHSHRTMTQNVPSLSSQLIKLVNNHPQPLLIRAFKVICMYYNQYFNPLVLSPFQPHCPGQMTRPPPNHQLFWTLSQQCASRYPRQSLYILDKEIYKIHKNT
jgi:hypothetical protein